MFDMLYLTVRSCSGILLLGPAQKKQTSSHMHLHLVARHYRRPILVCNKEAIIDKLAVSQSVTSFSTEYRKRGEKGKGRLEGGEGGEC